MPLELLQTKAAKAISNQRYQNLYRCSYCSTEFLAYAYNIARGTDSCGCQVKNNYRHGLEGTPIYTCWQRMKRRCLNPNSKDYPDYGGRGITVCESWLNSVEVFYQDMGDIPEGKSIDRIDNNGDYTPANCRWATPSEQGFNKRRSRGRSQYRGVTPRRDRWQARVCVPGRQISIGGYTTEEEAARAYDKYVRKYKLPNQLNFPEDKR
jgi:hypothetical protein